MPSRNTLIAIAVLSFHLLAIWALQTGLLRRAVEVIVPAHVLSEFIKPPAPKLVPPPPPPPPPPVVKQQIAKTPVAPPAPQPVAIPDPVPAPSAPAGITTPQPPPPPVTATVVATPAPAQAAATAPPLAPATPPKPPKVELPVSDADYLQNPKPTYLNISKRLNEQGTVLVRVLVGADGKPQDVTLHKSSGYDRLDQSALDTLRTKWRFVPGKRGGVPEAMWHIVPIIFVLE